MDPDIGTRNHENTEDRPTSSSSNEAALGSTGRRREPISPGLSNYLDEAYESIIGKQKSLPSLVDAGPSFDISDLDTADATMPDLAELDGDFTDYNALLLNMIPFEEGMDPDFFMPMGHMDVNQDALDQPYSTPWLASSTAEDPQDDTGQDTSALVAVGSNARRARTPSYSQPGAEASQIDLVTRLFQSQTCIVMSVKNDWEDNPWRSLIWPLTKTNPELRHALNAMTCLQCSKLKPELHTRGLDHLGQAVAGLRQSLAKGTIRVDAALATTIALSLARTWEAPRTTTDTEYINEARVLLKQAIDNIDFETLSPKHRKRLSFLANTWVYIDVISRLSSWNISDDIDTELIINCKVLRNNLQQPTIDPLLGCAADLFPLIGKAADLVRRIWRDEDRCNSPTLVARAAELMRSAEDWKAQIDLTSHEEPSNVVSDAVQTAEAFRWALILMLRQAIPALPGFRSREQIAQKILVYLATVPAASGAICVHMFPLLIAGCEVSETENRTWVSERWRLMSSRLISGIVDRCVEMTEEAWRRRDKQERPHGELVDSASQGHSDGTALFGSDNGETNALFEEIVEVSADDKEKDTPRSEEQTSPDNEMAYPKARLQHPQLSSVRSRLNWLAVMHDWNWQVMLG